MNEFMEEVERYEKEHPRARLTVDCATETIARFDYQRGNSSRGEYLEELLDMVDGGSFAELDY